jgi:hypothetical protein
MVNPERKSIWDEKFLGFGPKNRWMVGIGVLALGVHLVFATA